MQVGCDLSLNSRATINGGNLTVVDLASDDAGQYECIASNEVASAISSTVVVVECTYRPIIRRIQSSTHLPLGGSSGHRLRVTESR